jgi:phosphatidylserine synthase
MPPMFAEARAIYQATRKRHDQIFNVYVMRPIAAGAVALLARTSVTPNQLTLVSLGIFVAAAALLVALPDHAGGVIAVLVLELSYLFDCADGMLARHKKIASKEGHLFDFFTDELKAVVLGASLAVRLWRSGGLGIDGTTWPADSIAAVLILGSATSFTNFIRRPEMSGKETTVEAFYETVERMQKQTPAAWIAAQVTTFLRFLNHYPSTLWIYALAGRLDVFFWIYASINLLYLGRGWLGLLIRMGRPIKR